MRKISPKEAKELLPQWLELKGRPNFDDFVEEHSLWTESSRRPNERSYVKAAITQKLKQLAEEAPETPAAPKWAPPSKEELAELDRQQAERDRLADEREARAREKEAALDEEERKKDKTRSNLKTYQVKLKHNGVWVEAVKGKLYTRGEALKLVAKLKQEGREAYETNQAKTLKRKEQDALDKEEPDPPFAPIPKTYASLSQAKDIKELAAARRALLAEAKAFINRDDREAAIEHAYTQELRRINQPIKAMGLIESIQIIKPEAPKSGPKAKGGKRDGAGRPTGSNSAKEKSKVVSGRVPESIARWFIASAKKAGVSKSKLLANLLARARRGE